MWIPVGSKRSTSEDVLQELFTLLLDRGSLTGQEHITSVRLTGQCPVVLGLQVCTTVPDFFMWLPGVESRILPLSSEHFTNCSILPALGLMDISRVRQAYVRT